MSTQNTLEILEFKKIGKNSLIAIFDVKILSWHLIFKGCKLFGKKEGEKAKYWVKLPDKEFTDKEGKKCYAATCMWTDNYQDRFRDRVLDVLKQQKCDISLESSSPSVYETQDEIPF